MNKIYETPHIDDTIKRESGIVIIRPRLISTNLFTSIINNDSLKDLKKYTKDIMNIGYPHIYGTRIIKSGMYSETYMPYYTPDFRFHDYSTPLLLACFVYKSSDYIEYLIKLGANVNYVRDISLYKFYINSIFDHQNSPFKDTREITPLMATILSTTPCKTHVTKLLISHSADVNFTNSLGDTPLLYAAWYGNVDIINTLIHNGANINHYNIHSTTPLCSSFFGDKPLHAKTILEHHPDLTMFLEKYSTVRDILEFDPHQITDEKIQIFDYVRTYIQHLAKLCSLIFPPGIGDPISEYIISHPF